MSKYPEIESKMKKTAEVLKTQLASVRAGRANAAVLDQITVDYYGVPTPIQQVASISVPDPRSLMIQPWDASVLKGIEKAILASEQDEELRDMARQEADEAAKQIPQFKHFEQQNLLYDRYPENIDEQNRYIAEGMADFVAIAAKSGVELSDIYKKNIALKTDYTLVFSQEYSVAESALTDKKTIQTYYLFQTKEN